MSHREQGPEGGTGTTATGLFVGIDVAKDKLDIAVRPSAEQWIAPQTEEGLSTLVALEPELVVLEATGGYELPVAVVNPRQVRAFARGIGQLAKTDALDAAVLARFAEVVHPTPRPCLRPRRRNSAPCWPAAVRCSGCWWPSASAWAPRS